MTDDPFKHPPYLVRECLRTSHKPLRAREIAEKTGLPLSRVTPILHNLKQTGSATAIKAKDTFWVHDTPARKL
ncbi:helix-turn-helix domain-containing protein [Paenirhodobacter enshiensis]|uniref:HTH iclR-type domain-containing protein n=1 Tax=Paenirhodobacter enshiensis TaxID=1105367 RepID=A0A086Y1F8_9RHOB|nr:helix-turn-helix domain-containing protein [Paenirhodobacter enshiensis]KFI28108.1 hypothetical protein CG50_14465 [Paenirhodobacter enshiensis]